MKLLYHINIKEWREKGMDVKNAAMKIIVVKVIMGL